LAHVDAGKTNSPIETASPAARAHDLQRQLSGITGGEGVLESSFVGYEPANSDPLPRRRTTANPLKLAELMRHLARESG
jgi:ribosomal protection tetracycline resistance protein